MNDNKKRDIIWGIVTIALLILMTVTVALQLFAFDVIRHIVLCIIILLLIGYLLVLDIVTKNTKGMIFCGGLIVVWIFNLFIQLIITW